jgi:hypothetical protein
MRGTVKLTADLADAASLVFTVDFPPLSSLQLHICNPIDSNPPHA